MSLIRKPLLLTFVCLLLITISNSVWAQSVRGRTKAPRARGAANLLPLSLLIWQLTREAASCSAVLGTGHGRML